MQKQLFANGPVGFQCFLGFSAVGNYAFLVAFAADAQHFFAAIHVREVKTGKFADAKTGGVEKLKKGAVAAKEQGLVIRKAAAMRARLLLRLRLCGGTGPLWPRRGWTNSELIQETVHLFGGEHRRNAFGQLGSRYESGGIFLEHSFADTELEKRTQRSKLSRDRALFEFLRVKVPDEFANHLVSDIGDDGS